MFEKSEKKRVGILQ